jgi:hypothetical protein
VKPPQIQTPNEQVDALSKRHRPFLRLGNAWNLSGPRALDDDEPRKIFWKKIKIKIKTLFNTLLTWAHR